MPRMYYVNPLNTADIRSEDLDANPIAANRSVRLPKNGSAVDSPSTTRSFHIAGNKTSVPGWDVYEADEDNTPTPEYQQRDADTLTFVGTVGSPAARVQETRNFSDVPPADAAELKNSEIRTRYDASLNDGVPVTVNATSAVVEYELTDRERYSLVWDPTSVPAPGLLVRTKTVINGKTRLLINGAPKITALLDQTLAHRTASDTALDIGLDDVDALLDGGATTPQIEAYDVEALPWPSNTLP